MPNSTGRSLIAVVLTATFISLYLWYSDSDHAESDLGHTLRKLRSDGTVIVYSDGGSGIDSVTFTRGRVQPDNIQQLATLGPIRAISFGACGRLEDQWLGPLVDVDSLSSLNLGGTGVDDASLHTVRQLPDLRELFLWRTFVSDDGVASLQDMAHLQILNLWDTATTDQVIDVLINMPTLRKVYLGSSPEPVTDFQDTQWGFPVSGVTPAGVRRLRNLRPDIDVVFWSGQSSAEAPLTQPIETTTSESIASTGELHVSPLINRSKTPVADWSGFLGPKGNGSSRESLPTQHWGDSPPRLLWSRTTGEGLSAPSVVGHRLIYTDRQQAVERAFCVNARTGEELWNVSVAATYEDALGYSNGPRSTPVVDSGLVYLMTADGALWCRRLDNGDPLWMCDTMSRFRVRPNLYGVGSTPIVHGNLLIVLVGGEGETAEATTEQRPAGIVAFDKVSGKVAYATSGLHASYASVRVARVGEQDFGIGFGREGLVLFDPRNGTQHDFMPWAAKVSGCVNAATPVVMGNQIFISEAYGPGSALVQIQNQQLHPAWHDPKQSRQRSLRAHWATPILFENHLYGCSGRHSSEGQLRCLDWHTGAIRWKEPQQSLSSLCLVDGMLINLTEYGVLELLAANPESIRRVGRFVPDINGTHARPGEERLLKYPCWTAPVYSNGVLFVRGKDRIAAFDLAAIADH